MENWPRKNGSFYPKYLSTVNGIYFIEKRQITLTYNVMKVINYGNETV